VGERSAGASFLCDGDANQCAHPRSGAGDVPTDCGGDGGERYPPKATLDPLLDMGDPLLHMRQRLVGTEKRVRPCIAPPRRIVFIAVPNAEHDTYLYYIPL
jgi:hypothetical protein